MLDYLVKCNHLKVVRRTELFSAPDENLKSFAAKRSENLLGKVVGPEILAVAFDAGDLPDKTPDPEPTSRIFPFAPPASGPYAPCRPE